MSDANTAMAQRITALAAPVVDDHAVELVEVEVRGARGSRVVRVVADADEGLDLDLVAELSRAIGDRLDEDDTVDGRYTLEVSSPGVDRPLRTTRQLARNVGRDLRVVRTRDAIDRGEKGEVVARLEALDDDELVLQPERGDQLRVPLADVDHARVVLPW